MFGSRKNVFTPSVYQNGRSRRRGLPRWMVILITGILIGAIGFWFIKTNYGPPQLSVSESQELQKQVDQLNQDKRDLTAQNTELQQRLNGYEQDDKAAANKLESSAQKIEDLQKQVAMLKQAMPKDTSGLPIAIRAADLNGAIGELEFNFLSSLQNESDPERQVNAEIVVKGRYRNGNVGYSTLEPVSATVGEFTQIQGKQSFEQKTLTPKTATITLKDPATNKILGQRTFTVDAK